MYVYIKKIVDSTSLVELNDVGFIKEYKENAIVSVLFLRINKILEIKESFIDNFDIHKTGDLFDNKICDRCFKYLNTIEYFSNNRHKKDNFVTKRPSCKLCRKIKDGKPIPPKIKQIWERKRPLDYSLFTCPICLKQTIVGISKVVLDHNHSSGDVRGWLCESCNTGIGRFDDDPIIVGRAIDWLSNH